MPNLSPRGRLLRGAIIYTPLFLASLALVVLMLVGLIDRAIVALVLLVGVTFLFGYQSIQSLRDLRSEPVETDGTIARRWTKRDALIAKSCYITVGKAIFHIPIDRYMDLKVGDTVHIVAYPHTGTVVSVERTGRTEAPAPVAAPSETGVARGRMRTLRTARMTPAARDRRPPAPAEPSTMEPTSPEAQAEGQGSAEDDRSD